MGNAHSDLVLSLAAEGTGSGTSSSKIVINEATNLVVVLDTTVAGGTPTFDVNLEWSSDDGVTWYEPSTPDAFTQVTAAGTAVEEFSVKGTTVRLAWTIAGTTPAITATASIQQIR